MANNNLSMLDEFFEDYVPEKKESEPAKEATVPSKPTRNEIERTDEASAWAKKAKEKREAAFAMIVEMSESVFKRKSKTKLIDYLIAQSNFPDYTVRNCLLIAAQRPGATMLKSYDGWKDLSDRIIIRKNSVGITVIEPGDEYTRRDGSVGRYYNTRTLFDISQIQGYDNEIEKESVSFDDKLVALFHVTSAFRIKIFSHTDESKAVIYSRSEVRMYINKQIDTAIIFYQLLVELAHSIFSERDDYSRAKYGFMCQAVGFIVCRMIGEEDLANNIADSFDVPTEYAELKKNDVISILESIKRASHTITSEYGKQLKKLKKRDSNE